jgi:DNA-binding transcriptional LysR family regulator
VAALPSVSSDLLPRAIARLRGRYPGISIALRDGLADRVLELIASREADFGVTSFAGAEAQLDYLPLLTDRIVALLPGDHPLARKRRLTLAALVDHPLILMDRTSSVRHRVDAAYAALGRMPAPAYEATFMATAVGLVRAGLGVTLLPTSSYEVATASDLAARPIADPGLERNIGVLRLRGRSLSPAAEAFLDALMQEAKAANVRNPRRRS